MFCFKLSEAELRGEKEEGPVLRPAERPFQPQIRMYCENTSSSSERECAEFRIQCVTAKPDQPQQVSTFEPCRIVLSMMGGLSPFLGPPVERLEYGHPLFL